MEEVYEYTNRHTTYETKTSVVKCPTLEKYGRNLNREAAAKNLSPVIGRDWEVERITNILSKVKNSNPMLLGQPGVGKTAIVEALAQRIHNGTCPESLKNKTIYEISLSSLNSGTSLRGSFEERAQDVLKDLSQPNIVAYIDEFHQIMGLGSGDKSIVDLANVFKPALASGKISVIGATTNNEYEQHVAKDGALTRRFSNVQVSEPSEDEAMDILNKSKHYYESAHGVMYSNDSVTRILQIAIEYKQDEHLPASAFTLLDEVGAWKSNSKSRWTDGGNMVNVDDVYAACSHVLCMSAEDMFNLIENKYEEVRD